MLEMDRKNFLILAFTLIINSFICNALEGELIVGAEDAQTGEYLYTVLIKTYEGMCTGGIIGQYYVITAAHCIVGPDQKFFDQPVLVVAGVNDLNDFSDKRREIYAEKVAIPLRYYLDNGHTGDIAVLKLHDIVSHGPNSRLILPDKCDDHRGVTAMVTGFGWNEVTSTVDTKTGKITKDGRTFGKMRFAHVIIQNTCTDANEVSLHSSIMCARLIQRNPNKIEGVCYGDSGGPLVVNNNILVGVVDSIPLGCNETIHSTSYTKITSYLKFIEKTVRSEPDNRRHTIKLRTPKRRKNQSTANKSKRSFISVEDSREKI